MACITPFTVKKNDGQSVPVPCGKCPDCKGRRASGWSFRLVQQGKQAMSTDWITLTYAPAKVPITRNGFMCLSKRDVQLFFKRLRKLHSTRGISASLPPIKYYAVGEYGTKNKRPHYHIILFNADRTLIQAAWEHGAVYYGQVSGASIGYTLKYMMKKGSVPAHRNDDRLPEFALMSKGLGESYLTPAMRRWHIKDLDNRMYIVTTDGKKVSMPRYYKDKIYNEQQRKRIAFFAVQNAIKITAEHEQKLKELHGENWRKVQVELHIHQFQKMYNGAEKNRDRV